jgi:hypothetical protein
MRQFWVFPKLSFFMRLQIIQWRQLAIAWSFFGVGFEDAVLNRLCRKPQTLDRN